MNHDELLTKFAMEFDDWPSAGEVDSHYIIGEKVIRRGSVIPIRDEDVVFTRYDWLQRRAELNVCTPEEDAEWALKDRRLNAPKFEVVDKEWSGPEDGLPPIGTVCRIEAWNGEWRLLDEDYRIDYMGETVVVATTVGTKREVERVFDVQLQFKPRMSPEERARNAIQCAAGDSQMLTLYQARKVYAAIRDGKVPGVVLGGGHE